MPPGTGLPARRRVGYLFLLLLAAAITVHGLLNEHGLLAIVRASREYDELSATVARQRVENAHLREEARRLREDPTAIEELARRGLGLVMPGETVFIILKEGPPISIKP